MALPQDSLPVLSTSPLALSSQDNSDPRLRHSPTLSRSFDPNDRQVRERQRTMDVDMALQLSRARRETIQHSPDLSTFDHAQVQGRSSPELSYVPLPALSLSEQRELDLARGLGHDVVAPDVSMDIADDETIHVPKSASLPIDIDEPTQPAYADGTLFPLLEEHAKPPETQVHHQQEASPHYDLPTYHSNVFRCPFDFTRMEEFAAVEKAKLGISSPVGLQAPQFSFPITATNSAEGPFKVHHLPTITATNSAEGPFKVHHLPTPSNDISPTPIIGSTPSTSTPTPLPLAAGADDTGRLLRHRKLSQSNPQPRIHRKGMGGKLALFENSGSGGSGGDSFQSLSARLGAVLGTPSSTGGPDHFVPSGGRQAGILNTGHDRPFRFSFYSNSLSATIHARSLSELPAEGQSFQNLFSGDHPPSSDNRPNSGRDPNDHRKRYPSDSKSGIPNYDPQNSGNRDTDVNTWWLDVLNPTEEEMKMLSEVFFIHPLTTEDILMEETREKIELFRNYFFVCFRSFEQDQYSPTYLQPLNMYMIVFREGILSFHFQPTPHPQNVRRRIKQFKDYISVTSDWISYALIDDITDAFGPLIQGIEYEVDSIDELVLILKEAEQSDMLRRIGTCRKKVMGLLRLMGNKADVVKGLAKRCNENWRVAPTSDIGLYLSDIQDHLITMTQNLNHYEKILSRSHSNYLAQISIEMTDANNQINDVLSKLTALGTVLIPMNLVTGLWGMNVHVPGQNVPGFGWFTAIIACLAAFAIVGGYSTYRFMVRK